MQRNGAKPYPHFQIGGMRAVVRHMAAEDALRPNGLIINAVSAGEAGTV